MTNEKIDELLKDTLKEAKQLYQYISDKFDKDAEEVFKSEPNYLAIVNLEGLNARLSGLMLQSNKFQIMYQKIKTLLQVRFNLKYDDHLVPSFFMKYLRGQIDYIQIAKGHKQFQYVVK